MVAVGNLTVGGTGKTPHVEYLIRLLCGHKQVAVLSRGYGRKTRGFVLGDNTASAKTLGDEPYQYFRKFGKAITVAVCESRAYAVPCIVFENPKTEVILLDDAFQHRQVKPQFNILLSDYTRPFYTDYVLPLGLLRESRTGANRADAIVVSKSPAALSAVEMAQIKTEIHAYAPDKPVFFTTINYGAPVSLNTISKETAICKEVILFAGLANITPLKNYVASTFDLLQTFDFKDHHQYKVADIAQMIAAFNQLPVKNKCFITTEKDMVKLLEPALQEMLSTYPVFYLPIEVVFLAEKETFDALVINSLNQDE
jgi:tetraacyldisaccharide 4'-kinase